MISNDLRGFEVTDSGIIALLGMDPNEAFTRTFSANEVLAAYGLHDPVMKDNSE